MKCPTCGANLQIEDEKCPFCQNPNPFAVKHRQDMQRYQQEFQETKQEVERKTLHFTFVTARIAVIAALLVMILGMIYAINEGPYRIWSSRVKKDIAKNAQEYRAELGACEEAGQWRKLYAFYDVKNLDSTRDFQDYTVFHFMIFDYKSILNEMTRIREGTVEDTAAVSSKIASHLDSFYKSAGRVTYESAYYDDNYSPVHTASYERIQEELEAALYVYCHLTKEELSAFPDCSLSKKAALIETGMCREPAQDKGEATEE